MAPDPEDAEALLAQLLAERIVVCDGAVGTMLHAAGVPLDRCLAALNIEAPALVRDLHSAYVAAGARIVQTNTFGANRARLARFGLEGSVTELNIAGARRAREAVAGADPRVLVAGSVGPATGAWPARADAVAEQVAALADWVDLLVLETFGDIDSLAAAVGAAVKESDLPVIAQMTFGDDGRTLRGEAAAEAAQVLAELDVLALGANCTVGPAALQQVVAGLAGATDRPVAVQPNAGLPQRLGSQFRYAHNTRYFGEAATRFVGNGASIIGGCCGTTPAHIRAIAKAVAAVRPARPLPPPVEPSHPARVTVDPSAARGAGGASRWPDPTRFEVIVALPAPRDEEVAELVARAGQLRDAGADLLALQDPAPPRRRVNPIAAGVVLRERLGVDVLLPVETVDRSLAALQADLLGAHALGLRIVVCRTGAPRVAGDYPDPGLLAGVDSVGLISALRGLNDGVDWRGVAMAQRTQFTVGAVITTMAADLAGELDRAEAKVRAGVHFLVTDVVYDAEVAGEALATLASRGIDTPVIASLAPFDDISTLERLSHEAPHLAVRSAALAALRRTSERPDEALDAALATVEKLRGLVRGVVLGVAAHRMSAAVDLIARLAARRAEP